MRPRAQPVQMEATPNHQLITQRRLTIPVADSCGFRHESCTSMQTWNVTESRQQQQNTTNSPNKLMLRSKRRLTSRRPEPFLTVIRNGKRL